MKGNILEAFIGAIVLIVASFFMYFAYISSGEKIKDGYTLTARFDDVSGITVGSDIKLNGIKVGVVKSLSIDSNYQAKVSLLFKNEVQIPDDSSASITSDGIMGNKFIGISAGYSETKYKNGDEIEMTKSAVNLEKLIDKFVVSAGSKSEEK